MKKTYTTRAKSAETETEPVNSKAEVKETVEAPAKKVTVIKAKSATYDDNDLIICRSIKPGSTYMTGLRSKEIYEFEARDAEVGVRYCDLMAAINKRSSFLFAPFIIVEDEEFVNNSPKLKDFYDHMYTAADLEAILELPPSNLAEVLPRLSGSAQEALKSAAATGIADGTFDSLSRIKVLDSYFETDLVLLAGFED